jgi:hypothetical protein
MDHGLGVDLLHMPEVGGVVRPVEMMAGALLPAVEADLERAHEILARQHRMLFIPHDALAEIQPGLLERRGVVAEVGVAAPDVERRARLHHPRGVGEPGQQHLVERFVADEVVLQRPVLGPHLLARLLRIGDAPSLVEALVVELGLLVLER